MASYIERRKFLATLGAATAAWPSRRAAELVAQAPDVIVVTGTEATAILQPVTMEKLL
jgi:hypothetical protein